MRIVAATLVLLVAVTSVTFAARGFTVPLSNAAVATVVSEDGSQLDLMVVWRGSPGWMRGAGQRSGSGGGSGRAYQSSETFGGVQLDVDFDFSTRIAHVDGHRVSMGSNNVVLVDHVDRRGRSIVVRTSSIDGVLPNAPDVYPLLAHSPGIVTYLQCDAQVPNPGPMDAIADWCAPLIAEGADVAASPESHVRGSLQRYVGLVRKMDHAGIAAMFAPDGEVVNPGREPIKGRAAIQAFLEQFAGYHVINEVMMPVSTTVEGNHAAQAGTYRQRVQGPDGNIIDVSGNFVLDWIRDGSGAWLIQRAATTPQS